MSSNERQAAIALAALGHERRLTIFRILVQAGPEGLNVGEIGAHLNAPPSTLAHHLRLLTQAGLVAQEKQGREVRNRARYAALEGVFAFVLESCCAGVEPPVDA